MPATQNRDELARLLCEHFATDAEYQDLCKEISNKYPQYKWCWADRIESMSITWSEDFPYTSCYDDNEEDKTPDVTDAAEDFQDALQVFTVSAINETTTDKVVDAFLALKTLLSDDWLNASAKFERYLCVECNFYVANQLGDNGDEFIGVMKMRLHMVATCLFSTPLQKDKKRKAPDS